MTKSSWIARAERFFVFGLYALALVGLFFRFYKVDSFPGINGDELVGPVLLREWLSTGSSDFVMPSGHFGSPFYLLMHLVCSVFYSATWLVRLPAVLSGSAVVVAHFIWGRKIYARSVWLASLVFLACFPLAVTMSRISWEPALTPLLIWLLLYFLQRHKPLWSIALALFAALNQIIAVLVLPATLAWILFTFKKPSRRMMIGLVVAVIATIALTWVAIIPAALAYGDIFQQALQRLIDVTGIFTAFYPTIQMIVGITSFRGFSLSATESIDPFFVHALPIFTCAILATGFCLAAFKKKRQSVLPLLFFFGSYVIFYLVSQPIMIEPGYERFPLFLFVPFCLALAYALDEVITALRAPFLGDVISTAMAVVALVMFVQLYLEPFENDGGHAQGLYPSAANDPKVVAVEDIVSKLKSRSNKTIVTDVWFIYYTAKYFSYGYDGIRVVHLPTAEPNQSYQSDSIRTAQQLQDIMNGGGIAFGFAGGNFISVFQELKPAVELQTKVYSSTSGAPIVETWEK